MTYVVPQVLVFQDFSIVPSAAANPLPAHVSGPHAFLLRYAEPAEQARIGLGYYDPLEDHSFEWPHRPAGGIVDFSYAKLWVKDALLQYFEAVLDQGAPVTKTAGYNNRVRSSSVNFAANGGHARDGVLLDRDVRKGDVVKVRGLDANNNSLVLWTYVYDLVGDVVPSAILEPTIDADNPPTQPAVHEVSQVAGPVNCITLTPDISAYDGLPSGNIVETYDILVTQSSINGDLTTAAVRVISGSGTDDEPVLYPEPAGTPTAIGHHGLLVTFDSADSSACSSSAAEDSVTPTDLVAGQRFHVVIHQDFTYPTITQSGTYAGTNDTTYVIEVTRGGRFSDAYQPQVTVTTTNGIDMSGPTTVTGTGVAFPVGTLGVMGALHGPGLRLGDKYYIECTGLGVGPIRTLVLGHNLSGNIAAGSALDVTLFIRNPLLQVTRDRIGYAPLTNWDPSATEITVRSGIVAYDPTWTNQGVPEALPVVSEPTKQYGMLYSEYRAWLPDLSFDVGGLNDPGELDAAIPGALTVDNPLKWGVYQALQNSNGTNVYFTSVADPSDPDSWSLVLSRLIGKDNVYELVPLTRDRTVLGLYQAHCNDQSSPENGLWRVLWVNESGVPSIPVVSTGSTVPGHLAATTTDGLVALAVIEDDPQSVNTEYTIVRVTSSNSDFVTNGVRPGDVVRTQYTGDGFGDFTYTEYVVDTVVSEDELRLVAGPAGPINVASKIEVWRNQNADDEAASIAKNAGSWGDRRVRATWPDQISAGGTLMEGYFMNCALAGLASGVLPHQGLTHLELTGYDDVSRTTKKFNKTQLDAMAAAGTWIVTQDGQTGKIFTRHAVTTGNSDDVNQREEMITRNVDSISFRFKDYFAPYIGVTNVTPSMQGLLSLEIDNLIAALKTESATTQLGGQLISATVVSFGPHLILRDRYVLMLTIQVPYSLDNFEIHLMV